MILTGSQIQKEVESGRIMIDPFDEACVNPNSYNYHLGSTVWAATGDVLDAAREPELVQVQIGGDGLLLHPGRLYLGHTAEIIGSEVFVTSLIGRSSVGRLGLYLQLSADLGHQGAVHGWTLELTAIQTLRVYAGMRVGQVSFWSTQGPSALYRGAYATTSLPATHRSAAFE